MAKGYRETAENSRKLPELPVPGRKKSCYAQEVSVEEEDLKAHCQDQKISHHVGNADLIRGGAHAETATADIDAPVEAYRESGEEEDEENAQDKGCGPGKQTDDEENSTDQLQQGEGYRH